LLFSPRDRGVLRRVMDVDAEGLAAAVRAGTYRAQLEALRDDLAQAIEGLGERQVVHKAPLAKQLADVLATLADLPMPDAAADSVETAGAEVEAMLRLVQ
jgi:hypothetical protein